MRQWRLPQNWRFCSEDQGDRPGDLRRGQNWQFWYVRERLVWRLGMQASTLASAGNMVRPGDQQNCGFWMRCARPGRYRMAPSVLGELSPNPLSRRP